MGRTITRQGRTARTIAAAAALGLVAVLLPAGAAAQLMPVADPTDACAGQDNPAAPFADRDRIAPVHVRNVDCAFNEDVALGFADDTFRGSLDIRRDQFASFLFRTLQAADVDLPAPRSQGFTDIAGNVHEDAIDVLAELGLLEGTTADTFSPQRQARRDQVATVILRTVAVLEDVPLANLQRDDGPFGDVAAGNVHRRNINGAHVLNLALGRTDDTYLPAAATSRQQMASFLMRLLVTLRSGESLVPPALRASELDVELDAEVADAGTERTVEVIARDTDGDPVGEVPIRLEVYRDDAGTGIGTFRGPREVVEGITDAQGTLDLSYLGPQHAATDTLVLCVLDPGRTTCQVTSPFTGAPDVGARIHVVRLATWDDPVDTLDVVPVDETIAPGGTRTATVTARDDEAAGVAGAELRLEVYRDDASTPAGTFAGPVVADTVTTGGDGTVEVAYDGPDTVADDVVVVCRAVRGSCLVVDTVAGSGDTRFTGLPFVDVEVQTTATTTWDLAAESASARATGLLGDGVLGVGVGALLDAIGATPVVEVSSTGDPIRADADDELLTLPDNPLLRTGLIEVDARIDLAPGLARAQAQVADVDLVSALDAPLVAADAITSVATASCPVEEPFDSALALQRASEGTEVLGLAIAGTGQSLGEEVNQRFEVPFLLAVTARQVEATQVDGVVTYTVRGLVVETALEALTLTFGEASASIDCK